MTSRIAEVAALVRNGASPRAIAEATGLTLNTVHTYMYEGRRDGVDVPRLRRQRHGFLALLPAPVRAGLCRHADARGISVAELAAALVAAVVRPGSGSSIMAHAILAVW